MFKRSLYILVVVFSLLFNVQAGFTHDVEHINHQLHDSLIDCEDCLLKHHLVKSINLIAAFDSNFHDHTNLNDNYPLSKNLAYTFVAFQSNAP